MKKTYIFLTDAISDVIGEKISSNTPFSAYDITQDLRKKVNADEIFIMGLQYRYVPEIDKSSQDIQHSVVKQQVHAYMKNKDDVTVDESDGYIKYVPKPKSDTSTLGDTLGISTSSFGDNLDFPSSDNKNKTVITPLIKLSLQSIIKRLNDDKTTEELKPLGIDLSSCKTIREKLYEIKKGYHATQSHVYRNNIVLLLGTHLQVQTVFSALNSITDEVIEDINKNTLVLQPQRGKTTTNSNLRISISPDNAQRIENYVNRKLNIRQRPTLKQIQSSIKTNGITVRDIASDLIRQGYMLETNNKVYSKSRVVSK